MQSCLLAHSLELYGSTVQAMALGHTKCLLVNLSRTVPIKLSVSAFAEVQLQQHHFKNSVS